MFPRLRTAISLGTIGVISALLTPGLVAAYGDVFYSPYWVPHYGFYYEYPHYSYRESQRLRRELRRQRLLENENDKQRHQELDLLRRQAFANQQTSARQACFYRTTGGFEICADLFEADSAELARCESLVIARNPSCNEVPLKTQVGEP